MLAGRGSGLPVARQSEWLAAVMELIGARFHRPEPRRRSTEYVHGLLADLRRKNGWTLSEHAGAAAVDGMQRLLRTADWDIDGVRDDLRAFLLAHLADPDGVYMVSEAGFVKKGDRSAGVARQYNATTGRADNCQLGLFLAYSSPRGRALIDRELYLPRIWADDPARRAAARIPANVNFATKPQLAMAMFSRTYQAGLLSGWVTAGRLYGPYRALRSWLVRRRVPFVLATSNDDVLVTADGLRRRSRTLAERAEADETTVLARAHSVVEEGPDRGRGYDWVAVALSTARLPADWRHWLLIRRESQPVPGATRRKVAFYRCTGPADTPLGKLISVADGRWAVGDCLLTARNRAGLDHYQVRDWRAWYAHVTLSMVASSFLSVSDVEKENGLSSPVRGAACSPRRMAMHLSTPASAPSG